VPRGYVRANLLEKDPESEQLIPSDRSTKLMFGSLQNITPSHRPGCFPHYHPKVIRRGITVQFTANGFNG